jgi:hypothetical protein
MQSFFLLQKIYGILKERYLRVINQMVRMSIKDGHYLIPFLQKQILFRVGSKATETRSKSFQKQKRIENPKLPNLESPTFRKLETPKLSLEE